jgi:hypothetical protein
VEAVDQLFRDPALLLLGAGEVVRLPAEAPLLPEDGKRTKGVAAVERYGMIQDVENAHF